MPDTPLTIGALIDTLDTIRDKRRDIAAQDKALSKEYTLYEARLLERLEAEGIPKSSGNTATASIAETDFVNIEDYDTLKTFIEQADADYLYQRRRLSQPAVKDFLKGEGDIPGISVVTRRTINLRKTT